MQLLSNLHGYHSVSGPHAGLASPGNEPSFIRHAGINLEGVPVTLLDTAGVRKGADAAERIGVERSQAAARSADIAILVIDAQVCNLSTRSAAVYLAPESLQKCLRHKHEAAIDMRMPSASKITLLHLKMLAGRVDTRGRGDRHRNGSSRELSGVADTRGSDTTAPPQPELCGVVAAHQRGGRDQVPANAMAAGRQ